jgi:hypothetical protein
MRCPDHTLNPLLQLVDQPLLCLRFRFEALISHCSRLRLDPSLILLIHLLPRRVLCLRLELGQDVCSCIESSSFLRSVSSPCSLSPNLQVLPHLHGIGQQVCGVCRVSYQDAVTAVCNIR